MALTSNPKPTIAANTLTQVATRVDTLRVPQTASTAAPMSSSACNGEVPSISNASRPCHPYSNGA